MNKRVTQQSHGGDSLNSRLMANVGAPADKRIERMAADIRHQERINANEQTIVLENHGGIVLHSYRRGDGRMKWGQVCC